MVIARDDSINRKRNDTVKLSFFHHIHILAEADLHTTRPSFNE